jgi:hypothetical protein
MGRRLCHQATLDPDQGAALHHLVEAFGADQVTVTAIQATKPAGQDLIPTTTPPQASLLEEAA